MGVGHELHSRLDLVAKQAIAAYNVRLGPDSAVEVAVELDFSILDAPLVVELDAKRQGGKDVCLGISLRSHRGIEAGRRESILGELAVRVVNLLGLKRGLLRVCLPNLPVGKLSLGFDTALDGDAGFESRVQVETGTNLVDFSK